MYVKYCMSAGQMCLASVHTLCYIAVCTYKTVHAALNVGPCVRVEDLDELFILRLLLYRYVFGIPRLANSSAKA